MGGNHVYILLHIETLFITLDNENDCSLFQLKTLSLSFRAICYIDMLEIRVQDKGS